MSDRFAAKLSLCSVFCLLLTVLAFPLPAKAASDGGFHFSLSEDEGLGGDTVQVALAYDGGAGEIGAFMAELDFDPAVFEYVEVRRTPAAQRAYTGAWDDEQRVRSIYTLKSRETCLASAEEVFLYRFRVKEDAPEGEAFFSGSVHSVVDPDAAPIDAGAEERLTFRVLPPPSHVASLVSLTPQTGNLQPDFSPDCRNYRMEVPFDVTSITFEAEAAEGGICKINRRNLGAGGTETAFLLTVTAEDGKTKAVYTVTALRQAKATLPPKPTAAPTPKVGEETASSQAEVSPAPVPSALPTASPAPAATPSPAPVAANVSSSKPAAPARKEEPAETGNLTIVNGEASLTPLLCALVFLALVVLPSRYLSQQASRKLLRLKRKAKLK